MVRHRECLVDAVHALEPGRESEKYTIVAIIQWATLWEAYRALKGLDDVLADAVAGGADDELTLRLTALRNALCQAEEALNVEVKDAALGLFAPDEEEAGRIIRGVLLLDADAGNILEENERGVLSRILENLEYVDVTGAETRRRGSRQAHGVAKEGGEGAEGEDSAFPQEA